MLGDLDDARYAWTQIEAAYASSPDYASVWAAVELSLSARGLPPVCLLAGGLGTRLGATVRDTPKPLLEVAGEPFLLHQLRLLSRYGAARIVLCVGYLGELIEGGLGRRSMGSRSPTATTGPASSATLGAVRKAAPLSASGSSSSTATRTCAWTMPRLRATGSGVGCQV